VAAGGAYEKAYEIDAGNRVIAYHLADLLFERQRGGRARFPFCRLNNGGYANAKSLREGRRVERALDATSAARQRVRPLPRRSADSTEWQRYEQGAFHG
jgi:type IV pilus assembly protein PilF